MSKTTENLSVGLKKIIPVEKIFATSFILKVIELFSGFFINFLLSRILSTEDYGKFVYGFNIVLILGALSAFGFESYIVKKTALFKQANDLTKLKGLLRFSNFFVFILSSLFAVVLVVVFYILNNEYTQTLIIQAILLPLVGMAFVNQAFIRGNEKVFEFLFPISILRPLLFLSVLFMAFLGLFNICLYEAIILNIAMYGIGFLLLAYFSNRFFRGMGMQKIKQDIHGKAWLKGTLYFVFINILFMVNNRVDMLILGLYRPPEDVAVFGIAYRIAALTSFVLMAFNTAYSPVIAKNFDAGKIKDLQKLLTKNIRFIGIITLLFVIGLYLGGEYVLSWFGEDYVNGLTVLLIVAIGQLVSVWFGPVGNVLTMTGLEKYVTRALIFSGLTNLALSFILVPQLGMLGTAIAAVASLMVWNVLEFYYCLTKAGLNTSITGKF